MTPAPTTLLSPLFGRPRHLLIAAGVLALAIVVVFGDLLVGGGDRILSFETGDTAATFVGWSQFLFGEMARGNLPLWNPHLFGGAPCLGGFQEALLYPPTWIGLFLPVPQAINFTIVLHVFLAGLFMYAWTARRGIHPAAGILAGLVFMFGGAYFLHISAGHLPNLRTMIWAPLVFLAIDDLTTTRSLRGAWLGAGAAAMAVLAGHPQYVYYLALAASLYAAMMLIGAQSRRSAGMGLLLMGVGAVGLAAMQLFTGLQAASESVRSALPLDRASIFPFPPENLLTALFPNLFVETLHQTYWGRWYLWEDSVFIGATALVLAILGAIFAGPAHRKFAWAALAMIAICFVVALGIYTPLYALLFDYLPGFGSFRGASKFLFAATPFTAFLCAIGLDRLLRQPPPLRLAGGVVAVLGVLTIGFGLAVRTSAGAPRGVWARCINGIDWNDLGHDYGVFTGGPADMPAFLAASAAGASRELLRGGGALLLVGAVLLAIRYRPRAAYALAGLATIELLAFALDNRPTFAAEKVIAREDKIAEVMAHFHALPDDRIGSRDPVGAMGAGAYEIWGNDPMVLSRYAQFMAMGQRASYEESASSSWLIFDHPTNAWGMVRLNLVVVHTAKGLQWINSPVPRLPRGLLVENAAVIANPTQLKLAILDKGFNPTHTVLLENPVSPLPHAAADASFPPGQVELSDLSTDEIDIKASIARPCILLITDNYSTGWRAEPADGSSQRYEVVPADYTLRGIALSPGEHHFILRYLPRAYVIGKWVTIVFLGLYGWTAYLLWQGRSARVMAPPPVARRRRPV